MPPTSRLITVGYEGRSAGDLIADLSAQGVSVLVDVRLNPISRKAGLSKKALSAALRKAGISYEHHRTLGNPSDNRDGYRAGASESREIFSNLLKGPEAQTAIRHVCDLLSEGASVALLCFEEDHRQCHRQMVACAVEVERQDRSVLT